MRLCAVVLLLLNALIVGCGGSGEGIGVPGPSAEGVYAGTLTGGASTAFQAVVLENDALWIVFGTQIAAGFLPSGFALGPGTSRNGSYTASSLVAFGAAAPLPATANATYSAADATFTGTIASAASTATLTSGSFPSTSYTYQTPAALAVLAGSWVLTNESGEPIGMFVAIGGSFEASTAAGCNFSGTFTPRASGKNIYDVSMSFATRNCTIPGQNVTGIALAYPLANGKTQLILAASNPDRTAGTIAAGTR
jgi:hypothetical protein